MTPGRVSSAGSEAVDLCRSAGFFLDEWQQWVLEQALGERDDGKWSALEVGLLVPRQNGKGAVLMARMLAGLFLFDEELVIYSAHLYSTSSETFLRIKSLVENCDHLRKRCKKPRTSHGEEGIELLNGNRLRFLARTKGGGRGFSGDCVVLDEAFNLPAAMMSAMFPAMSARDNPQIWYTTTPPQEFDPPSRQIRSVRHRVVSGVQTDRLAYYEWSCEPGVDPDDRAMWAQANPALNIRITEEFIESEQAAIPPEQWVVERLGVFEEGEGVGGVISTIQWDACVEPASQIRGPYAFAYDVSLDHSWSSIAICCEVDGRPHVEVAKHEPGTEWVPAELARMCGEWKPLVVMGNPAGPAAALLPKVLDAGVEVETVSGQTYAAACGLFLEDVLARRLRHLDDPMLAKAVAAGAKRPLGDAWAWSQRQSSADITPLTAATLALWGWSQHRPPVAVPAVVNLSDLLDDWE